jgi:hypothetical protein
LILVLSLLSASGPAIAQGIDSPYRFIGSRQAAMAFAGYLSTGKGALDLGPASGPIFGARYGITISGPFALEGDVGYFSRTRAVYDTVPGDTTRQAIGDADMSLAIATGSLRFNLTGPRTYHSLLPYLIFGAGVAVNVASDQAPDTELPGDVRFDFGTSFIGQLGGGIEWFAGDRFGIRLDARNILWKLKTPRAFLIKGEQARLLPADEWAQNLSLTAGLVFRF